MYKRQILVWALFLRSAGPQPLTPEQIRAELDTLTAITVEYTSSPILVLNEPSLFLGMAIPFSSEPLTLPIRAAVRGGFALEDLKKAVIALKGETLRVQLPAPTLVGVQIELGETGPDGHRWAEAERAQLMARATEEVRREAIDEGLLRQVQANALRHLSQRFHRFGYTVVGSFRAALPAG